MSCIFCEKFEFHICHKCVQNILAASDEAIKEGIKLAFEKGYEEKASALEKFTGVILDNGRKTGTNTNGRRTRRSVQLQERTNRLSTKKRKATIHRGK